jgi:ribulose-phosphate 3-epimerase
VAAVEEAGAERIHIDVMDGQFVTEITIGPLVTRAVRRATSLPLDVHLMIVEPERHLEAFAAAGATSIAVHLEACPHLYHVIQQIRSLRMDPSVALNPATPPGAIEWVLPLVSTVLVMTVEPGAGGQPFIPEMLAKIKALADTRRERGLRYAIAVDGGIGPTNARAVVEAGASVLVAGTAVYAASDGIGPAMARLRDAVRPPRRRP